MCSDAENAFKSKAAINSKFCLFSDYRYGHRGHQKISVTSLLFTVLGVGCGVHPFYLSTMRQRHTDLSEPSLVYIVEVSGQSWLYHETLPQIAKQNKMKSVLGGGSMLKLLLTVLI